MSVVYGWDPVIVRLAAVLLGSLLIPIAILAYGVLWIVIPEERPALPSGLPLNSV
jgi:phage shock protein PspC (stress-responsive transcriptional regulator)